jgi:diacylglycerol kinase family enzyme
MKVALFHNPGAGKAALKGRKLVRQLEYAGHEVLYVSMKTKDWERAFREPIERTIIAGGDGTVSRLAPWLAGRNIPFCILPLGTANNCARSLDQMHSTEAIISRLHSAPIKKIDLGIVTSSAGHRIFVESVGIGLLALFMSEMRALEKKKKSRIRSSPEKRLAEAIKYLGQLTRESSGADCELLVDDEIVAGDFLLLEISNMRFVGPNLDLASKADPADGHFDVIWVEYDRRKEWRDYLAACRRGEEADPPVEARRCQRIVFRYVDVPVHVDGKVFLTMATPISIRIHSGALEVMDFSVG